MLIFEQKRSTGRQWTTQEQAQVGNVLLTKYTRDDLLTRQVDTEIWWEIHAKGANEKHNRTHEGKTSK